LVIQRLKLLNVFQTAELNPKSRSSIDAIRGGTKTIWVGYPTVKMIAKLEQYPVKLPYKRAMRGSGGDKLRASRQLGEWPKRWAFDRYSCPEIPFSPGIRFDRRAQPALTG
jgi:hypothetical protein